MIPPPHFERELKLIDKDLFVRWEYFRNDDWAWPYMGKTISGDREDFRSEGRFRIYHKDAKGKSYVVFDVCTEQGEFLPLDRRVLAAIHQRDRNHGAYDRLVKNEVDYRTDASWRDDSEAEERVAEGLEQIWRQHKGTNPHALGAPGTPAASRVGKYTVVDKRRFT